MIIIKIYEAIEDDITIFTLKEKDAFSVGKHIKNNEKYTIKYKNKYYIIQNERRCERCSLYVECQGCVARDIIHKYNLQMNGEDYFNINDYSLREIEYYELFFMGDLDEDI